MSYLGLPIIVSRYATAEPGGTPYTDDMRAMIEDLRDHGLILRVPAAFKTAKGFIVHPSIADALRRRLA